MQGVSPWEFVNTAASVITDALAAGRDDDAGRVLEHTLKELRRNASWSGGGGAESQLVRALLDGDSVRPAAIAMAIRLDAETGSERMGSSWAMTRALESAAERVPEEALERPGVACATDEEIGEDERRLRATLLDIRDRLGEADTATLVGPLAGRLRGDDAMRRGGNLPAWARERAEGDPSTMWDDIEAAARVARLRGDEEDRRPEDAPWMAGYLERLAARETAPSTIGANSSGSISTASATPGRTPTPPAPPPRISLSR
jgi:hypothetical protein